MHSYTGSVVGIAILRYTYVMDSIVVPTRFVQPDVVVSHFHIQPGDVVADIGAGNGYFLPALVAAVGESGLVYACELQKNLVESLGDQARRYPDGTVKPVWGDVESVGGTKIATDSVDRVVLVNMWFLVQDRPVALEEITRILRPGGKVFLIDWSDTLSGLGPRADMLVPESDVVTEFEATGFVVENTFPAGDHHYGLAFRLI